MNLKETIMFRNRIWKWAFFSLLCIFSGCGKEDAIEGDQVIDENYRPFVVEGKEWVCQETNPKDGPNGARGFTRTPPGKYLATYLIKGDTIIDGESCKKLWRKEEDGQFYIYCFLLERDRKVFNVHGKTHSLIYDFGMTEGSTINSGHDRCTLEYVDTLMREGEMYRRLHVILSYNTEYMHKSGKSVWIEGIGSICGALMSYSYDLRVSGTITCSINGEEIFTYDDFTLPAWRDESK